MQKEAGPLYAVQFAMTLFQVFVLAHLIAMGESQGVSGITRALFIWAAFVIPTLAAAAMWNNDPTKVKWARFLIQGGYQLLIFIMFALILMYWK
jgi:hypothetical protein